MISTCCVTNEALAKSRKAAARAARTHRRVYVTGCGANLAHELVRESAAERHRRRQARRRDRRASSRTTSARSAVPRPTRGVDRVRAFVKIQDGCSFSCAFCVIPLVRGATRSRSAEAVLGEIRRRVAQGHREVVLTGINLGCFRDRDAGYDLPRLVREAGATPGLERLRLSSIEINHVSDALVAALRDTPTVARHLHVPLQSGDDRVLAGDGPALHDARRFSTSCEPLAADFNLTSDVIVGFPAEDETAFANTLRTVERAGHHEGARLSVLAATRNRDRGAPTRFPPPEKKARGARLRALSRELEQRRWQTEARSTRSRARRPSRPGLRRRLLAVPRRRAGR